MRKGKRRPLLVLIKNTWMMIVRAIFERPCVYVWGEARGFILHAAQTVRMRIKVLIVHPWRQKQKLKDLKEDAIDAENIIM